MSVYEDIKTGLEQAIEHEKEKAMKTTDWLTKGISPEKLAKEKGSDYIHSLLKSKNPSAAARLHPNDTVRIVRALELYESGISIDLIDFSIFKK